MKSLKSLNLGRALKAGTCQHLQAMGLNSCLQEAQRVRQTNRIGVQSHCLVPNYIPAHVANLQLAVLLHRMVAALKVTIS